MELKNLENYKNKIEDLQLKIISSQQEYDEVKKAKIMMDSENTRLNLLIDSIYSEKKEMTNNLMKYEENSFTNQQDLDIFRNKANELKLKFDQLESQFDNKNIFGLTFGKNLTIIDKLNMIIEDLTSKNNDISDKDMLIFDLNNEKEKFKSELEKLISSTQKIKNEQEDWIASCSQLRNELNQKNDEL